MTRALTLLPLLAAGLLPLTACGLLSGKPDADDWAEDYAKATCDFSKRCMSAYFWYEFDDVKDCVDEYTDDIEDYQEFLEENCEFDEDKAADCLSLLGGSCKSAGEDLDDIFEACNEAWDCRDGGYYDDDSTYTSYPSYSY